MAFVRRSWFWRDKAVLHTQTITSPYHLFDLLNKTPYSLVLPTYEYTDFVTLTITHKNTTLIAHLDSNPVSLQSVNPVPN